MPKTVKAVRVIEGGKFPSFETTATLSSGTEAIDAGEASLLPGLIDACVHLVSNRSAYAVMGAGGPRLDAPDYVRRSRLSSRGSQLAPDGG